MQFEGGKSILGEEVDVVFIGSCTNSRIEDLREVADIVKGKRKADNITAWIVPGSKQVEEQAREEGIDKVLEEAGFELREEAERIDTVIAAIERETGLDVLAFPKLKEFYIGLKVQV